MPQHDNTLKIDTHFHLDNVPPAEIRHVLRVLAVDIGQTPDDISASLLDNYGFKMQSDKTYTPRRLYDMGLALTNRIGSRLEYRLSDMGTKLQSLQIAEEALAPDLLHYLMFSGYSGKPAARKNLWSYRVGCEQLWSRQEILSPKDLALSVGTQMVTAFPDLDFNETKGGRFTDTSVGNLYTWLRALEPSPLPAKGKRVTPRTIHRPELVLLALSDTYDARKVNTGDGIILTDEITRRIAGVFFMETATVSELLRQASARYPLLVRLGNTLAGTSVHLSRRFTLNDF